MPTLGFIGTGTIAAAFIEGLMASGQAPEIVVSRRSEAVSARLVERYPNVRRVEANQEVADRSDIVFLGMLPPQIEAALEGVRFREGQIVCSFVTGVTLPQLQQFAPGAAVCRLIPLPMVRVNEGPLLHYPRTPEILELIGGLGEVVIPESEEQLMLIAGVSGTMSTFFELQDGLVRRLVERGTAPSLARNYVCSFFLGLSRTSAHSSDPLPAIARAHETPGGLNERTCRTLREAGWFDEIGEAIEAVRRVPRTSLK